MGKKKPPSTFGQRLRLHREQKGLSRAQLAERAGVSRVHVYRLEADMSRASFDLACRLAKVLGVGVEAFVGTE